VRDREAILESFRNPCTGTLESPTDEVLGVGVEERVDDVSHGHRHVEERTIRVVRLGSERWVHQHGIERIVIAAHVREDPFDLDFAPRGIPTRDFDGPRIRVDADDPGRARQFRADRKNAVPAAQVYDGATCDVAAAYREMKDFRRDRRGSRVLLY
jgi:hypothetical protein